MDYKEKYKQALKRAKELLEDMDKGDYFASTADIENIFPELKKIESDDEYIRQRIIHALRGDVLDMEETIKGIAWLEKQGEKKDYYTKQELIDMGFSFTLNGDIVTPDKMMEDMKKYLAWKEKHDEQKQTDTPKFKVDNWIIATGEVVYQIKGIQGPNVTLIEPNGDESIFDISVLDDAKLWTIADAKDGDVLATENFIFIFKNVDDGNGVHYYCQYEISKHENDNQFDIALPQSLMGRVGNSISHYSPATKEQRNLLFQKMKEAGYKWDADKKELKKVEPKKLDADKVIAWLEDNTSDIEYYVNLFKEDFGLC